MKYLLTVFACFLVTSIVVGAPSLRDYGSLPSVSMMTLSPDGEKIAFRKLTDEMDAVLVVSVADGALLNRLDVEEVKPRNLYFLFDDFLVLVASEHEEMVGSNLSYELSTAFGYNLKTDRLWQLLRPGDGIYRWQSGLGDVVGVSPDKRYAYMPAFFGGEEDKHAITFNVNRQNLALALMEVDLENPGRKPRVHISGSPSTRDYLVDSRDGTIVEYVFNGGTMRESLIVHQDGTATTLIENESARPSLEILGFSEDGNSVLVSEGGTRMYVQLDDGTRSDPVFTKNADRIGSMIVGRNNVVQGVAYEGFRPRYSFLDESVSQGYREILKQFPKQSLHLAGVSKETGRSIYFAAGNESSGVYYLFEENGTSRALAQAYSEIAAGDVNPIIEYAYKARDGLTIPTLLTVPRSRVESLTNMPTVLLPHGGPGAHDTLGFDWLAQALANEGYLVIQPQYRGSTGFGEALRLAGYGQWGKKMQDDLIDGIDHFIERGIVDSKQVAIVGASYGGYAALAGVAFSPERFRCAVSINGVSDLPRILEDERFLKRKDRWIADYWSETMIGEEGGKPVLKSISPIYAVEAIDKPVLLIHGKDDSIVPFDQAKAMERALKKAKKEVELVVLKDEDHFLAQSPTRIQTLNAVVRFLRKHLNPS